MEAPITELLQRLTGTRPRALQLETSPLRGGLVSPAVLSVTARYRDDRGARRTTRWVVKLLQGAARREATAAPAAQRTALAAVRDQLRILRRADACWS